MDMDAEFTFAQTQFHELTLKPQAQMPASAYALEVSLPCGTLLRGQGVDALAGLVPALR